MTTFKKCDPKTAISKRFGYCCFIPILLFAIFVIGIILFIVISYKLDFNNNINVAIPVVVAIGFPLLVCIIFLAVSLYKVLIVTQVKEWKICSFLKRNTE